MVRYRYIDDDDAQLIRNVVPLKPAVTVRYNQALVSSLGPEKIGSLFLDVLRDMNDIVGGFSFEPVQGWPSEISDSYSIYINGCSEFHGVAWGHLALPFIIMLSEKWDVVRKDYYLLFVNIFCPTCPIAMLHAILKAKREGRRLAVVETGSASEEFVKGWGVRTVPKLFLTDSLTNPRAASGGSQGGEIELGLWKYVSWTTKKVGKGSS